MRCLPGFCQEEDDEDDAEMWNVAEGGIRNGLAGEEAWEDSWERDLGVCRVDCFSRSLSHCVREALRSCTQLSSVLAKAGRFYSYITTVVPPEKLCQVFDGPGMEIGALGNASLLIRDWATQLKVDLSSLIAVTVTHLNF